MAKNPKPVDLHVGSRVRDRRKEIGLTQMALSDQLGVTFQQVQKYERATNRIGSSRLLHIADILQVPITFFFDDAPGQYKANVKSPPSDFVEDFLAADDGQALVRAFVRIRNVKLRRKIVELVKHLAL